MKTVAVIPARYASSRFPGKPLVKIGGTTMIERVYRQASKANSLSSVIVATDDQRIFDAVREFGGNVVMTRDDHVCGTDRIAEVVDSRDDIDVVVNVQGDEPLIDPYMIDRAVEPLLADASIEMSTIAAPLTDPREINSPDIVKVVVDTRGFALYFSRAAIPFYRNQDNARAHLVHVGLYVYRRTTLLKLSALQPTANEQAECLEQLRALDNGIRIKVVTGKYRSVAVDRPADVAAVERAIALATP
jgi:3-deoxy-manno-octulosonate cytidylyltransferase (CMP-KDO synthetase)